MPLVPTLKGFRFPRELISYAVWAYYRFAMSLRDVEDLFAVRGIVVSYESFRLLVAGFPERQIRLQASGKNNFLRYYALLT